MAKMKKCPICGSFHKKRSAFKACYERAHPPTWTVKDIGKSKK